jgi:hypothetical protein
MLMRRLTLASTIAWPMTLLALGIWYGVLANQGRIQR